MIETLSPQCLRQKDIVASFEGQDQSTLWAKQPVEIFASPLDSRWLKPLEKPLTTIVNLPNNWDSYGAKEVSIEVIEMSLKLLQSIADPGVPLPAVVPTGVGGIQFEWHKSGIDLEVEIDPSGQVQGFFKRNSQPEQCPKDSTEIVIPRLRKWADTLRSNR